MLWRPNNRRVTLVSSAAIRSTSPRTLRALRVMSSRLPIGVATTYRVGMPASRLSQKPETDTSPRWLGTGRRVLSLSAKVSVGRRPTALPQWGLWVRFVRVDLEARPAKSIEVGPWLLTFVGMSWVVGPLAAARPHPDHGLGLALRTSHYAGTDHVCHFNLEVAGRSKLPA